MNKFSFFVKNEGRVIMPKCFLLYTNIQFTFNAAWSQKFQKIGSIQ